MTVTERSGKDPLQRCRNLTIWSDGAQIEQVLHCRIMPCWKKAAPLARRQRRALPWARPPHAGPHAPGQRKSVRLIRLRGPAAVRSCLDRTTANVDHVGTYATSPPGSMPCSRRAARSLSSSVMSQSSSLATVLRPAADPAHSFSRSTRAASNCSSLARSAVTARESCRAAAASLPPAHPRDLLVQVFQVRLHAHPAFEHRQAPVQRVEPRQSVTGQPGRSLLAQPRNRTPHVLALLSVQQLLPVASARPPGLKTSRLRVQRSDNLTAKVVTRPRPDTRRQKVSGPAPLGYRRTHLARKRRSLPESSAVPHQ